MRDDWMLPDWPAPAGVRAVCTTRAGGVSSAPYDALNLGDHVGDDPAHVAANRAIFAQAIGARPVFLNQVHGTHVVQLDASTSNACTADALTPPAGTAEAIKPPACTAESSLPHDCCSEASPPHAYVADACVTNAPGVACTIMVADCLPVLLASTRGDCVAAAHAGWRGLAGQGGAGVLEQTFKHFCALAQMDQAQADTEVIAWLGPCIGPQAFEVGGEVRAALVAHTPQAAASFVPKSNGKWLADLAALARQRLAALGVSRVYGNDSSAVWCTAGNASRFFSHRRDRVSGRFAASVWLERGPRA